VKYDVIIIVIS